MLVTVGHRVRPPERLFEPIVRRSTGLVNAWS
jgi:hypothetical protein